MSDNSAPYTPYGKNSLWKGPSQYPYVKKMNKSIYSSNIPWGRKMKNVKIPDLNKPCDCSRFRKNR